jgi:hypothetical protein
MAVLTAQFENEVPSNRKRRYMRTVVRVSTDNGLAFGVTRIWTRQPAICFHGAVTVLASDETGKIYDFTEPMGWGVDGFRVPFKTSDRSVPWTDLMDPAQIGAATRLEIFHTHMPESQLRNILADLKAAGETVATVAVALGGI